MDIRQLATFQAVARYLSFNRAAVELNYAQSSISAQIQALEEELGVRLFDRLGRRILLTEAGTKLLNYAEKMLELADETRSEVMGAKELRGSLTVKVPESLGVHRLPPVIKEFRARFPGVRLRFTSCSHDGLQKDLRTGITDLAFLLSDSISAADLSFEVLGIEPLVLVAGPAHRLASFEAVRLNDLRGESILFSTVDCSYRRGLEAQLGGGKIPYDLVEFSSVASLKACVMSGVGLTILPEIATREDVARGTLATLPWADDNLEVANLMIWFRNRWMSPSLKAFMEVAKGMLEDAYEK
ncbi:MAG: LysR family transcriptional regulator [Desulfobacteraceae bacterium]|nr:LysR family transcriptional regulator [Desulfobacteraceae bacterium]